MATPHAVQTGSKAICRLRHLSISVLASFLVSTSAQAETTHYALGLDAPSLLGSAPSEGAGAGVVVLDFDGDGLDDIAVAAPAGEGSSSDAGRVYLWMGGESWADREQLGDARTIFLGADVGGALGGSLLAADMDGDGYDDLVIGAPYSLEGGTIYIVPGQERPPPGMISIETASSGRIVPLVQEECLGLSMAVGDLDGSGSPDLLLGSPCSAQGEQGEGAVYILPNPGRLDGPVVLDPGEIDLGIIRGTVNGENLGTAIGVTADFSGTGLPGVVVGSPYWSNGQLDEQGNPIDVGRASFFAGRSDWAVDTSPLSAGFHIEGSEQYGSAGVGILAGSDLNGDGLPDIAVASPAADHLDMGEGKLALFFGGLDLWTTRDTSSADAIVWGSQRDQHLGTYLGIVDVPTQGPSLMLGSPSLRVGGARAGGAYFVTLEGKSLIGETTIDQIADVLVVGREEGEGVGSTLAVARNLDDEGRHTLLLGAPAASINYLGQGRVYRFDSTLPVWNPEGDDADNTSDANGGSSGTLGSASESDGCGCTTAPPNPTSRSLLLLLLLPFLRRRPDSNSAT